VFIPDALVDEDDRTKTDKDWKLYFGILFGY
jgi:hypothetical protein